MKKNELDRLEDELTAEEILIEYPYFVMHFNWDTSNVSIALRHGAFTGTYSPAERGYRIKRWSVEDYLRYLKRKLLRQMPPDFPDERIN